MIKKAFSAFLVVLFFICFVTSCDNSPSPERGAFRVGEEYYNTLAEAVSSTPKNAKNTSGYNTIYLTRNVSDAGAVIDHDVDLIFGGYTYTLSKSSTGIEIEEEFSVSLTGGVFKANGDNEANVNDLIKSAGNLQINNTVIDVSGSGLNALNTSAGEVELEAGTRIATDYNRDAVSANGTSVVSICSPNVTLNGCLSLSDYAHVNLGKGNVILTDNIKIDGDNAVLDKSEATITFEIPTPDFAVLPSSLNVAPSGKEISLSCSADNDTYEVEYKWYRTADGKKSSGVLIEGATDSTLSLPEFTEKGVYYYYCGAVNVLIDTDSNRIESAESFSDVISVAFTGLPVVYVDTNNHEPIISKTEWKNATISIDGASNSGWNFEPVNTSIKGRGNSSWKRPKKPYSIKLETKQKILGMPKHKRWVLIANYLDNSFMKNSLAFYISEQLGMEYTVHGQFVDLVLNGQYEGLYWLGEAIKVDDKRVDVDEDDFLIELDAYYDEEWKFRSPVKELPYMVKNDDEMTSESLKYLSDKIEQLENLLYPENESVPDEQYKSMLDVDSWAKFWLVNEIMDNTEIKMPRSCFISFDKDTNVLKAGPVWDFDWSSLSLQTGCHLKQALYYDALFKSDSFTDAVKSIWNEKHSDLDVSSRIEELRSLLGVAAEYDTTRWGAHKDASRKQLDGFDEYVDYFKKVLINKIQVVDSDIAKL